MSDYAALQSRAATLIAANGQDVTLTYKQVGDYDTATGTVAVTDTVVVTSGVVLPLSRGLVNMPGTTIRAGDKQLLLVGDIVQPMPDDTASIGGNAYTLIEVSPLNPGGTNLIYDCVIRGAA